MKIYWFYENFPHVDRIILEHLAAGFLLAVSETRGVILKYPSGIWLETYFRTLAMVRYAKRPENIWHTAFYIRAVHFDAHMRHEARLCFWSLLLFFCFFEYINKNNLDVVWDLSWELCLFLYNFFLLKMWLHYAF